MATKRKPKRTSYQTYLYWWDKKRQTEKGKQAYSTKKYTEAEYNRWSDMLKKKLKSEGKPVVNIARKMAERQRNVDYNFEKNMKKKYGIDVSSKAMTKEERRGLAKMLMKEMMKRKAAEAVQDALDAAMMDGGEGIDASELMESIDLGFDFDLGADGQIDLPETVEVDEDTFTSEE